MVAARRRSRKHLTEAEEETGNLSGLVGEVLAAHFRRHVETVILMAIDFQASMPFMIIALCLFLDVARRRVSTPRGRYGVWLAGGALAGLEVSADGEEARGLRVRGRREDDLLREPVDRHRITPARTRERRPRTLRRSVCTWRP